MERAAAAQGRVCTARDKLHELDGKLDVTDAANAFFDVDLRAARSGDPLLHPPLVPPDALDKQLLDAGSVDEIRGHLGERRADGRVPRHKTGLHQGLPLPGFRPGLVIGAAGGQRPRDRSEAPFGAQPQVHAEDKARLGCFCQRVSHRLAQLHGLARRHRVPMHEDQINVGGVV